MATARLKALAEPREDGRGRHVFVVCKGHQCRRAGAENILDDLLHRRGSTDADLRVGASRCLGHCELAPAMVEDGQVLGAVSLRRLRVELMRLGLE